MVFYAEFTPMALNDIDETVDYIGNILDNHIAAKRFYDEVKKYRSYIERNPYMYALYHDDEMAADGCRYALVGNYIMLYTINEDNKTINIIRVIYGGRDISKAYNEQFN